MVDSLRATSGRAAYAPGSDSKIGKLAAYGMQTMKEAWKIDQRAPFLAAVLSTGGSGAQRK
jgi:hypothetical protein